MVDGGRWKVDFKLERGPVGPTRKSMKNGPTKLGNVYHRLNNVVPANFFPAGVNPTGGGMLGEILLAMA